MKQCSQDKIFTMLQTATKNFSQNKSCRICGGYNLVKFLDLGNQPLANSFVPQSCLDSDTVEFTYPLDVYFCHDCNLAQLINVVDKEVLFKDYIYFSSGMPKLSDHFQKYAEDVVSRFLDKDDFVVELASNDGILLKFFKDNGYKTLGVDPAGNVVKKAIALGVNTIVDFFSEDLSKEIVSKYGKAKVIMANNVVAHINDHHDLAKGVANLLDEKGVFILEAPYLVDMFENLTYDTIYHEHLSYLAVRPLSVLFGKFGLEIFEVEVHQVQGQSLRVFVGKKGEHKIGDSVGRYIDLEKSLGLDSVEAYFSLAKRIEDSKTKLVSILNDLKKQKKTIAAYGAPAKGNTLLNYCQIGTALVDYASDGLPSKQGLLTPGMHIPVVSEEYMHDHVPDYFLMLAWNYFNVIKEKEKSFVRDGGKFIIPVGKIEIL